MSSLGSMPYNGSSMGNTSDMCESEYRFFGQDKFKSSVTSNSVEPVVFVFAAISVELLSLFMMIVSSYGSGCGSLSLDNKVRCSDFRKFFKYDFRFSSNNISLCPRGDRLL